MIIAIAELIAYLALASASAETWQGRLVLYTGDNMNVHQWLSRDPPAMPWHDGSCGF